MASSETWIKGSLDGKLFLHRENDGPRVLRHGLEEHDTEITVQWLFEHCPSVYMDLRHKLEAIYGK